MSMLGLRDLVLIAQTPSSLHHQHQGQPISENQTHTHTPNLPLPSSAASLSVGFGIFPLLTATPCVPQPHQNNEVQECGGGGANSITTTTNYWNLKMCQEVNNPPKKGVINVADHDDEKGVMESEENGVYGPDFRVARGSPPFAAASARSRWGGGVGGNGGCKRPRAVVGSSQNATSHSSNSNATTPKSLATSSFHQDASFKQSLPGHVRAPAVFKCHRVSAIGNGEDEFAYLATVQISGHVFKGFLYDHGVDGKTANVVPCVSELQLGNNCSGKNRECSSAIAIGVANNNAYPASAS
ncbi:hypothetical protein glysoja_047421 [Glycine soja]|uniref:Protein LATERAL ROOT PRIMORDIUM 1 n=1 Tax=Glycine soja TaxID=3848 RepID=A0A0B2PDW4_GLYSO|nr:hypothetical protein glysoja_047421 [Glycine soja]